MPSRRKAGTAAEEMNGALPREAPDIWSTGTGIKSWG